MPVPSPSGRYAFATAAVVALLASATAIVAQSAPPVAEPTATGSGSGARALMAACRGDMQLLCAGVERGGGARIQCLKNNEAKLTGGCRSAIASIQAEAQTGGRLRNAMKPMRAERANVKAACTTDVATLCGGGGKGQAGRCLRENEAKLSSQCSGAILALRAKAKELREGVRVACSADAQTLCGSGGRPREAMMCLREKQAQASPNCQQALAQLPQRKPRGGYALERQPGAADGQGKFAPGQSAPGQIAPGKTSAEGVAADDFDDALVEVSGQALR
ncbi:MAG: hypothetical protein K2Y05_06905 [Hyphomicrobiaceae bacterium]|nr:hypothetical protein [Hyphomicrobiaceae bacterium]